MNYYKNNAAHNGYFEMTDTMEQFGSIKQDWASMVGAMINDYLNSGLYKQALDGKMLLGMFSGFIHD